MQKASPELSRTMCNTPECRHAAQGIAYFKQQAPSAELALLHHCAHAPHMSCAPGSGFWCPGDERNVAPGLLLPTRQQGDPPSHQVPLASHYPHCCHHQPPPSTHLLAEGVLPQCPIAQLLQCRAPLHRRAACCGVLALSVGLCLLKASKVAEGPAQLAIVLTQRLHMRHQAANHCHTRRQVLLELPARAIVGRGVDRVAPSTMSQQMGELLLSTCGCWCVEPQARCA